MDSSLASWRGTAPGPLAALAAQGSYCLSVRVRPPAGLQVPTGAAVSRVAQV
jgi:hypothetical protein